MPHDAPAMAASDQGLWHAAADSSVAARAMGWKEYSTGDGPEDARAPQRQRSSSLATDDPSEAQAAVPVVPDQYSEAVQQRSQHRVLQPQPMEVPVAADLDVTVATGASMLAPAGGAAEPSWDQPYTALLSGPGFSYGADEDGVFETDAISFGSADGGNGFMLDNADFDDEWEEGEDGDRHPLRKSSALWSAGTAGSGSGERAAAAAAALLPPDSRIAADAAAAAPQAGAGGGGAAIGVVLASAGSSSKGSALGAAVLALRSPWAEIAGHGVGVSGAQPDDGGDADTTDVVGGDADAAVVAAALLPPRYGSHESVGSAGAVEDYDRVSGEGAPRYIGEGDAAADADYAAAEYGGNPGGGAPGPAALAAAAEIGLLAPLQALAAGEEEDRSDAASLFPTAALPASAAAPPFLPPEVYLGFVHQLVASVRTAAQATATYLHNYGVEEDRGQVAAGATAALMAPSGPVLAVTEGPEV